MAKNKIELDLEVDDKGTTKKVAMNAKKASESLDKTAKSARQYDRNIKGAAGATNNTTKAFSKMQQGMGGLVGIYATVAAQVFAVSAAFQFLKSASDISNLIAGQEALAATTGVAYKTITNSIKDATAGQLTYAEAAKAAAIGTASGLSPDQLNRLGSAAKNASIALGRDLTDSFNRLVRGVTKAEPELLDELGIILRLETATEKYALAIGKAKDDLTAFERSQAVANEVLTQAEKKFGQIEEIMDPSAASLNRFVTSFDTLINTFKSGLIEGLRPVFDFLSKNTYALTAALGLVALPIIKQILPNFKEWGDAAEQSLKRQERVLKVYNYKLDKAKKKVQEFSQTQAEALKQTAKSAEKLIGDQPKTKTGQGGFEFLLNETDSKAAQRQAKKILDGAEANIDKFGKVTTGKLKGYNAQQVADLRASYNKRVQILTSFESKHKLSWARMGAQVKLYGVQATRALGVVKTGIVSLTSLAASAGAALSAALGWIGLITLVVSFSAEVYRFFFPIPEKIKEAREATDKFIESGKTLNEELQGVAKVDFQNLLGLTETITATGNALNTANILSRLKEFENIDINVVGEDRYQKARSGLQQTFDTLSPLIPGLKSLGQEFKKTGTLSAGLKGQLSSLVEDYVTASSAAQRMQEVQQTLNTELSKTSSSITQNPFSNLASSARAAAENINTVVSAANREASRKGADVGATRAEFEAATAAATRGVEKVKQAQEEVAKAGGFLGKSVKQAQRELKLAKQTAEALAAEVGRTGAAYVEAENNAKQIQEELVALGQQQNYINALATNFTKIEKDLDNITARQVFNKLKFAQAQTLGITVADKIKNIESKSLQQDNQKLNIQAKQLAAEAELQAAVEQGTDEQIKSAALKVYQLQVESKILEENINLENERNGYVIDAIRFEEQLLTIKNKELEVQRNINALTLQKKRVDSGIGGLFGFEQATRSAEVQSKILEENLALAAQRQASAAAKFAEVQGLNFIGARGGSDEELAAARKEQSNAIQGVKLAELEIERFGERDEALLRSLRTQKQLTQARLASLSINPAEQQAQEIFIQAQQQGISLSQLQKEEIRALTEEQYELQLVTEGLASVYSSVYTGFENAFAGIITGTLSVKQAFANLAVSILQDLAKMIAKMLVFKAIQAGISAFGGGGEFDFASQNAGAGGFFDASPFRYGGISEAPKMAMGGVLAGPQRGYPAVLHGTEAVVPLPNNRSIPVEFKGGGQQMNNVTVNVSMDSNGNSQQTSQSDSSQGENIGRLIASAVQKELQNQKRSGGILNPYGVA